MKSHFVVPDPPASLSRAGRSLWRRYMEIYELDEHHHAHVLQMALESWDRVLQCQQRIAKDGMFVPDRFGVTRLHPAVVEERRARAATAQCLKMLRIDVLPHQQPGRPATGI